MTEELDLANLRQREVQMMGAAISVRSWRQMEDAYNKLRDKIDRELIRRRRAERETPPPSQHREPIEADRDLFISLRGWDADSALAQSVHQGWYCADQVAEITAHRLAFSTPAASDAEGSLRETFYYLCKWVERGLFDKHHTAEDALKCIAYHPGLPWMEGRWDVDHKPYAAEFYKAFPKAAAGRNGEDQADG